MKKTVSIAAKPAAPAPAKPSPDSWVSGNTDDTRENTAATPPSPPAAPEGRMKRLTIDIPEDLHMRLKVACARRGTRMADEVRALLEAHVSES